MPLPDRDNRPFSTAQKKAGPEGPLGKHKGFVPGGDKTKNYRNVIVIGRLLKNLSVKTNSVSQFVN